MGKKIQWSIAKIKEPVSAIVMTDSRKYKKGEV